MTGFVNGESSKSVQNMQRLTLVLTTVLAIAFVAIVALAVGIFAVRGQVASHARQVADEAHVAARVECLNKALIARDAPNVADRDATIVHAAASSAFAAAVSAALLETTTHPTRVVPDLIAALARKETADHVYTHRMSADNAVRARVKFQTC